MSLKARCQSAEVMLHLLCDTDTAAAFCVAATSAAADIAATLLHQSFIHCQKHGG